MKWLGFLAVRDEEMQSIAFLKVNSGVYMISLLLKPIFMRKCFPSDYSKTPIKGLIRYGNVSGAILSMQLLQCKAASEPSSNQKQP